jgi:hypothetical protein
MLGFALLVAMPSLCMGQSPDPATKELIEKLLARIDTLEKRVAQLEQGNAAVAAQPALAAPASPVVTALPPPPMTAAHAHDQAPTPPPVIAAEAAAPIYPLLRISGFSDIDFSATNLHGAAGPFGAQTLLNTHSGFQEGQFALHFSSALSQKVSVFGELSLTARTDAGTGTPPASGFNAEVERMIVRYDLNDYAKFSFGRYHTPINYWNTAFHHGQWLQTTISRPEMTQFGSSFIPVHFVGALFEGQTPANHLNLNYNFGLGNGRGQIISRAGDAGDINNNRAWLVNAFIKPDALYGLQVGGSAYRDMINTATGLAAREWIESAHVVWQKESPEFIGEFANVHHQPIFGGVVSNSQAWYLQGAYRLPGVARQWKPYYRFEQIHVPRSDAIFKPVVPVFSGSTAGVRYDITSFAAFKLEYRNYWRRDLPSFHGIFTQTSFTF